MRERDRWFCFVFVVLFLMGNVAEICLLGKEADIRDQGNLECFEIKRDLGAHQTRITKLSKVKEDKERVTKAAKENTMRQQNKKNTGSSFLSFNI